MRVEVLRREWGEALGDGDAEDGEAEATCDGPVLGPGGAEELEFGVVEAAEFEE